MEPHLYMEGFMVLNTIKDIVLILAGISAVMTFALVTLRTRNIHQLSAIVQYFQQGDKPEEIDARDKITNFEIINPKAADKVCNFFHLWGLVAEKGYLPMWIFVDQPSGKRVVELYSKLKGHIEDKRVKNKYYAKGFEGLHDEIKKKNKQ